MVGLTFSLPGFCRHCFWQPSIRCRPEAAHPCSPNHDIRPTGGEDGPFHVFFWAHGSFTSRPRSSLFPRPFHRAFGPVGPIPLNIRASPIPPLMLQNITNGNYYWSASSDTDFDNLAATVARRICQRAITEGACRPTTAPSPAPTLSPTTVACPPGTYVARPEVCFCFPSLFDLFLSRPFLGGFGGGGRHASIRTNRIARTPPPPLPFSLSFPLFSGCMM